MDSFSNSSNCFSIKLNMLLDTVYDLNDEATDVSKELDKLISSTVKQVEDMLDYNDNLMESWS
jgi:hypothetical protein